MASKVKVYSKEILNILYGYLVLKLFFLTAHVTATGLGGSSVTLCVMLRDDHSYIGKYIYVYVYTLHYLYIHIRIYTAYICISKIDVCICMYVQKKSNNILVSLDLPPSN